jgi:hypothetical protein
MSYTARIPYLTIHNAEEFGRWLAKYKVEIAGLAVYQVGASGKRYRDSAAATMVKDVAGGVALSPVTSVGAIPILGLVPPALPLAAIVGFVAGLPLLFKAWHASAKHVSSVPEPILYSELEFSLVGVSAKRRKWSEYLLSIYAALHKWEKIDGMQHPEQWAVGAAYAARTGGYPPAWSEQPKPQQRKASQPARNKRPKTSRTTITKARRALWRIMDEI